MAGLGYRPRAPVELAEFGDAEKRRAWAKEKGLTVFSLFSHRHRATEVDLFLEPPFDVERAYGRAERFDVAPGLKRTFVGMQDLIEIKRKAGRPQDLQDIESLESLGRKEP